MKNITIPIFSARYFWGISLVSIILVSCGSNKSAYHSGDGIYGEPEPEPQEEVVMVRDTKNDYYQNYFSGERENNEEYFTDIESYEGYAADTMYVEKGYTQGYAPWGSNSSNVSVNFSIGFGLNSQTFFSR